jgi:zinc protease
MAEGCQESGGGATGTTPPSPELKQHPIEQVTPESAQAVAVRYQQRNNRTVGVFIPTDKPERITIPSTPNVQALLADYQGRTAIAASEVFDATPANIETRVQHQVLPEGIAVGDQSPN